MLFGGRAFFAPAAQLGLKKCANFRSKRRRPEARQPRGAPDRIYSTFCVFGGTFWVLPAGREALAGRGPPSWKVSPCWLHLLTRLASLPSVLGGERVGSTFSARFSPVSQLFSGGLEEKQQAECSLKNPTLALNLIPAIIRINASDKRFRFDSGSLASLLPSLSVKTARL